MPSIRTALVHAFSRLLIFAMLFAALGTNLDDLFAHGHGLDIQKVAVLVSDLPSDGGDLDPFPISGSAAASLSPPETGHPPSQAVLPVQAIYSPPPRPPAQV